MFSPGALHTALEYSCPTGALNAAVNYPCFVQGICVAPGISYLVQGIFRRCLFVFVQGICLQTWPIRVCPGYLPGADNYSCFDQGALQEGFVNA